MLLLCFICLIFLFLIIGLMRSFRVKNPQMQSYSILIACRNEEKNLPLLFESLKKITYPQDFFEIIIVDDASTDSSLAMIKQFCTEIENAKYHHLAVKDENYRGKKAALTAAANLAKYDFFLFTDADCQVPSTWLQDFNTFIDEKIGGVIGYYLENGKSTFRRFVKLTNAGLFSATCGLGLPFSAAGGNFCVRQQTFWEVDGYEHFKHIIAGDDKLLLNRIKKTDWNIAYNPISKVMTIPEQEKSKKSEQWKRQYGKFSSYSLFFKIIVLIAVGFYIWLPFSIFFSLRPLYLYFLFSFGFWLANLAKHHQKFCLPDVVWLLIFPYAAIFYGVWGMICGWKWKN